MRKILFGTFLAFISCASSFSQVILDDFNLATHTGSVNAATSWNGNVTLNPNTITVGGTAMNDSGWVSNFVMTDYSSWNFLAITAQLDAGNAAPALKIGFTDDNGNSEAFTVLSSQLVLGAMTTVYVPLAWTAVDPTIIVQWNIGGGLASPGSSAFRMSFDSLSLTATGAAIPEPSTYAAIFGALALGLAAYRRRVARTA